MALVTYILIFSIIFQSTNIALCVEEGFDVVTELGLILGETNPNFQNNLNSLISVFVSESLTQGYFNSSQGEGSDRVYGMYLCRGDLSDNECHDCLETVRQYLFDRNNFRYYSNSIVYNRQLKCVVHYANSSTPFVYRPNSTLTGEGFGDNLAQHEQYNTTLSSTLQELTTEAGYGNWTEPNFATRLVDVAGTQDSIRILVQCRPDISAMNCSDCLSDLYTTFRPASIAGNVLGNNCLLKYNNEPLLSGNAYCNNPMPSYVPMFLVLLWATYFTFM